MKLKLEASQTTGELELTMEMKLFLDLHHPHVVACYGILEEEALDGEETATAYSIVTERCQTSLDHFLRDDSNWDNMTQDQVDLRK